MPHIRLAAAVAILFACVSPAGAQAPAPLRVIRFAPVGSATPLAEINVTFDRPVAGSLDRSVDAASILKIEPSIPGKIEWRDPVTIRLTPTTTLSPGATYTVTVANSFQSMDGSALAEPYKFSFRVRGPTLIGGSPRRGAIITQTQHFALVYSAPIDTAKLASAAFLELSPACAASRVVRMHVLSQARITKDDARVLAEAGGYGRNTKLDSLRRVITLAPDSALPHGCAGVLVAPKEVDEQLSQGYDRWDFSTFGDFTLNRLDCSDTPYCAAGPLVVRFSTPVRGADVLHHVRVLPDTKFTIDDTTSERTEWWLQGKFKPRTTHAVVVDTSMRDVFGQALRGNPAAAFKTTGYEPSIVHPFGNVIVERAGARTLAVQHMNIDTLSVLIAPVPDSMIAKALSRFGWSQDSLWAAVAQGAVEQKIPLQSTPDVAMVTPVRLAPAGPRRPTDATLLAVRVTGRTGGQHAATAAPVTLAQVTNLAITARIGVGDGSVWVTSVDSGKAVDGATVVLRDLRGKALATATTDVAGLAKLTGLSPEPTQNVGGEDEEEGPSLARGLEGFVTATTAGDRAVVAINTYDPDLSPWNFGISDAWGDTRLPLAGALFTERGIYRPGERVFAKAIVRDGPLGALHAPAPGDSMKWRFHTRDGGLLKEVTTRLSSFGTADQSVELPAGAPIGTYAIETQVKRFGQWRSVGGASYRVAEYRPPEFLVDLTASTTPRFPRDTFTAMVQARYLFGAPMGRAAFSWVARQSPMSPWEIKIPGVDGWYFGGGESWDESSSEDRVFANGSDTLDARGERALKVTLPEPASGRPSRVTIETSVTDINRQVVGSTVTGIVHPADFYIAVKPMGTSYFWMEGKEQTINVLVVRPDGQKVPDVKIQGTVSRREWHSVRRERNGISEQVGEWVVDTVATCPLTSAAEPVTCAFTPKAGGIYMTTFRATDHLGRKASTSFTRWASGTDWVPWNDESQFKMDVIPDRTRYSVGDTATILFASPFTNAEAWIAVEREGILLQRRIKITSGSTTMKLPITEAFAPNAFVSIVVVRGRSAKPSSLEDPGRPTMRVGYASLRVTPETKRLTVTLSPKKPEYRPGDSARVDIAVRDAKGRGQRTEVTLWAVDEGVLALTGYKTPDPIDLMYRERGLGTRLRSSLTSVAPQVPEGEKGKREPGGGGGAAGADVLRSRFQTTAFFLGSVITNAAGHAVATTKLPDNLTTFRLMAVAVNAGDRYGKGESSLLVTRPLLARQALPRFIRGGDELTAGAVINRRDGAVANVRVTAAATGVNLKGPSQQTATLAAGRGAEVRFPFSAIRGDSAAFRFDVTGSPAGADIDAVRVALPIRPDHHPRAHTVAGVLRDSASVELALPPDIDPARSQLSLSLGASPLAMIRGMAQSLHVYPYYCSEQVISAAVPLIALYRAQLRDGVSRLSGDPRIEIGRAIELLSRRQRADGGIGYWSSNDWSSAWLSAYAGMVMLDARDVGIPIDTSVVQRIGAYLAADLHGAKMMSSPIAGWYTFRAIRLRDQVAAADFLSRSGRPDIPSENELLRTAAFLTYEDRARLATVFARRQQTQVARQLMEPTWALISVEGRRAVLPDSQGAPFYFESSVRPIARVLMATLAVDPTNALVGPLVETLVQQSRASRTDWMWNTQDYASAIEALVAVDKVQSSAGTRTVRVRAGDRVVLQSNGNGRDSTVALDGLLVSSANGPALRVRLDVGPGDGVVYYYLTVNDIPKTPPVTPEDHGIRVERWYERFSEAVPTTSVTEGELVRVRLRVTVPSTRQFVVLDDALPAGLEAVDLSLRTSSALPGPGQSLPQNVQIEDEEQATGESRWSYGLWDSGWWSPFDHREMRDDRVVYSATLLWPGTYTATYVARATTPGTFIRPPAHAEEMYNPGLYGRSDGGVFVVKAKKP
jgi:alpha-2-macroglobulin